MWHTVRMKSETSWKLEWMWKWSIIERRKSNMAPKSCQLRGEGEIFLQCLENREEKGNFFSRISKIEKRKRNSSQKSWQSRGEREFPDKNLKKREGKEKFFQKLLKIERRTRHENSFLQLERENSESFLLENFSRARLLSRTGVALPSLPHLIFPRCFNTHLFLYNCFILNMYGIAFPLFPHFIFTCNPNTHLS